VRAVNLIPADGASGSRGGAGVGPYALLGALAVLLVGVLVYVLTDNQVVERRAQLASLQAQAQALQTRAAADRPYQEFAALAQARVQTVRQLGHARFDWHRAFGDLARVMPGNVWLTSLLGTVTNGVSVGGGGGDTSTLRGALPNPAIELTGCTTSHDDVARLLSRLRLMTGVVRVALASSSKADSVAGGAGGGTSDCTYGHTGFTQFGIVVFFAPLPSVPSPTQPGATGATAAAAAPPAAGTTPAASTTPAAGAPPAAGTTPAPGGAAAPAGSSPTPAAGGNAG
jgi:Tfp pilus assembly protein PilN